MFTCSLDNDEEMETVEPDEAEIAAEPSPLVEGIRAELKRLIEREPFTPGVVNRIKKIAAQSYKLMLAIDPTQNPKTRRRPYPLGNYGDQDDDFDPNDVIDGEEPAYGLNQGAAPFAGPETFGANVIRELVPLLTKFIANKKPDLSSVSREPDDWETTGSLVLAYRQATDAGLKDVADSIMARIEARTDPDVKKAVAEIKRSKAIVPFNEGVPDASFAPAGEPDISCAPPEELPLDVHVAVGPEAVDEVLAAEPVSEPEPEPEEEDEEPEVSWKYAVRKPDQDGCHSGPFDTIEEAQKHAFPPDDEIVELPGGRVIEMHVTTPGTADLPTVDPKYGVRTPTNKSKPTDSCHAGPFDTIEQARKHTGELDEIVELPSMNVVQVPTNPPDRYSPQGF